MLYYYHVGEHIPLGVSFFYVGDSPVNVSPVPVKYLYSADSYMQYKPDKEHWIYLKNRYGLCGAENPVTNIDVKSCLVVSSDDLNGCIFKPTEILLEDVPYFSNNRWVHRGYRYYLFNLHPKTLAKYLESYTHEVERI